MRNAIDKKKNGRLGAVLVAVGTVLVMLDVIITMIWCFRADSDALPAVGVIVLYVVFSAAVIVGVLAALWQRLREIEGGEADEARKY